MHTAIDGRPLKGAFLRISDTVNTMVEQLSSFASEVTRVAREVGTEGRLGGQAGVGGVAGTWKDLTDNVNGVVEAIAPDGTAFGTDRALGVLRDNRSRNASELVEALYLAVRDFRQQSALDDDLTAIVI